MRKPILLLTALLFLLAAGGLVLWQARHRPASLHSGEAPDTDGIAAARLSAHSNVTSTTSATATSAPKSAAAPTEAKSQQMARGLAELNDDEVVFYGRLLDQLNQPVGDAEVDCVIQVNNGVRVGTDRLTVKSDANGYFKVSGYRGKNLALSPRKAGYALATTRTSFVYSHLWPETERHVADAANPTVLNMWKLQGAEPLATIDMRVKLPFGNEPVRFDLLSGKVVETGGDLIVQIIRPTGEISQQNPQSWGVKVLAVGGGLQDAPETSFGITFYAPSAGYAQEVGFQSEMGTDIIRRLVFVQTRSGQIYSKLGLTIKVNRDSSELVSYRFSGVANTNGSRNWEGALRQ